MDALIDVLRSLSSIELILIGTILIVLIDIAFLYPLIKKSMELRRLVESRYPHVAQEQKTRQSLRADIKQGRYSDLARDYEVQQLVRETKDLSREVIPRVALMGLVFFVLVIFALFSLNPV